MYIIKQQPEDFRVEEVVNIALKQSGQYVIIQVEKRNINTLRAVFILSDHLRVKQSNIGFCGTKDKRAITIQYMSIKTSNPRKISLLQNWKNNKDKETWLAVKVIGYSEVPLSLGDHQRNKFTIVMRNITKKQSELIKKHTKNKSYKFINLFGRQRFGSMNKRIGVCLLRKSYKEAVERLLMSHTEVEPIKKYLKENPRDYHGALKQIPHKLLNLLIHSYQSYIWNKIAEKIEQEEIPIVGWGTDFKNKDIEKETMKYLKKNGITQRNFIFRDFKLATEGHMRKRIAEAKDLSITIGKDELNKNKIKAILTFKLDKGCYATVFVKQLYDEITK